MENKERDMMLSIPEFVMLIVTPFVAALLFIAWPITLAVGSIVLIVGSVKYLMRHRKK